MAGCEGEERGREERGMEGMGGEDYIPLARTQAGYNTFTIMYSRSCISIDLNLVNQFKCPFISYSLMRNTSISLQCGSRPHRDLHGH